jgi:hypothetical protein
MMTIEQEIRDTNRLVEQRFSRKVPQADAPKKEPVDWRAELYDDWDYDGIVYTIGKTLAWVITASFMLGWIYGVITEQVIL